MNKSIRKLLWLFLVLMCHNAQANAASPVVVKSPDGAVVLQVYSVDGVLMYRVNFNDRPVLEPSVLGMRMGTGEIGRKVVLGKAETYRISETYPWRGVHSVATNRCNGARIAVTEPGSQWKLEARVFNDGVAFRYVFPLSKGDSVTADNSTFVFPPGSMVWSQNNIKYYEGGYKGQRIEDIKAGEVAGPPVTVQLKDGSGFLVVTEAGLADFSGISLKADGNRGYVANLAGNVVASGDVSSPWRVIMVASNLNTLVNCDMVQNLSPAPDLALFPKGFDTEWIKPGRCVWSWLADKRAITPENMKDFSKLASELGFEYNLVDEGWSNWKAEGKDQWDLLRELVDYSRPLGVKIWVWKAYPDRGGIEGIFDAAKRQEFFRKCQEVGVVGLKIDFFDSENQKIIDFYQNALRDAAKYHLMINFHGANKPTGESRTFPNEMTREAIRGMENRPPWALNNTIFPFTRYLAGHADFTPVHFGNRMGETSWAHHLASAVVFTSPLLVYGADPQSMLNNPFVELIKSIPSVWDETIVLPQSSIGELALYARRKGSTWFIAALNGPVARQINIDLSFLGKGTFEAALLMDEKAVQNSAREEHKELNSKQSLTIELNAAGGFLARISKK